MSEFELFQVMDMQQTRVASNAMNFITLVFAYAVAAFLVGRILNRLITIALTLVYSMALIGPFLSTFSAARGLAISVEIFRSNFPDSLLLTNTDWASNIPIVATAVLPLLLGWSISIIYMHAYVRRGVTNESVAERSISTGRPD